MKIEIRQVGTVFGYEDYHNEYLLNGEVIGSSSYDKNQGLHIGSFDSPFPYKKSIYGKTPQGIAFKMEKILTPPKKK